MAENVQSPAADFMTAQIALELAETPIQLEIQVPTGPVMPESVLPVLQTLCDALVAGAVENVEASGKQITCRAGCGACCRQLVPITPMEARTLAELVDQSPEPRRTQLLERFREVIRRLEESGYLETLRESQPTTRDDKEALGLAYFGLGIPCPFLENESCSIHPDRPLICREHLVTSPPVHCEDPGGKLVEGIALKVRLSSLLSRFAEPNGPPGATWIPLPLALEWAGTHPSGHEPRPGPEWVNRLFRILSGAGG